MFLDLNAKISRKQRNTVPINQHFFKEKPHDFLVQFPALSATALTGHRLAANILPPAYLGIEVIMATQCTDHAASAP
jgi:hypothetical protein